MQHVHVSCKRMPSLTSLLATEITFPPKAGFTLLDNFCILVREPGSEDATISEVYGPATPAKLVSSHVFMFAKFIIITALPT